MTVTTLDEKSALVVIDLQNGIVASPTQPSTAGEVVARTVALADTFRARGSLVVLVRVSHAPDGSDAAPGRVDVVRPARPRPEGWDRVVDELAGHAEDVVVTKRNWGAFYGTDLDLQLRRRGITQIVLTGIATSMGVESTARAAHEHGYHVAVVSDAVADMDLANHERAVAAIFPRLGQVGTTDEVLALLR